CEETATEKGYQFLKLPKREPPRYAVFYMLVAILTILEAAGLQNEQDISAQLTEAATFIRQSVKNWVATVPSSQNPAKKLAVEIAGKSAVVYAGPLLAPVAYKWK